MTNAAEPTAGAVKRDATIISLVCTAHFFSHFYMLALPPLYLLIREDLMVSFTMLGGLMTAFSVASGSAQFLMGILVDRIGARWILIGGLATLSGAFFMMGLTAAYWPMLVFAFVAGLGNSVFHPADYTILGTTVRESRLGRAFGIHTFSGHVGWSIAPSVMIGLATLWDWRVALMITGGIGFSMAMLLIFTRDVLAGDRPKRTPGHAAGEKPPTIGLKQMLTAPILLMFLFFVVQAAVSLGMVGFLPTTLVKLNGLALVDANAVLTAYLVSGAAGVLTGGIVADRLGRLDMIAGTGFVIAIALMILAAFVPLPFLVSIFVFGLAGFVLGMIAPSRDLMVRSITPPGASGKVFGFVSTGLDIGGALTPLLFGYLIDIAAPAWVFLVSALFMLIAIGSAILANRMRETSRMATRAAE